MKVATLKNGTRDGALIVVSRDLNHFADAQSIAPTLQAALDDWEVAKPKLEALFQELESNPSSHQSFDQKRCHSPLPRSYQWADGSAYVNHVELVRKARGAEMPENFWTDPLMYQGGSDSFIGPYDPIEVASEEYGIDFESEVAVVTKDVPMGIAPEDAMSKVALFMIVNDVSLRNLIPAELAKGFGFFQSKPASAFAPVAITPDEFDPDGLSKDGVVQHALTTTYNRERFGAPLCGVDMTFSFSRLISHAAKTRHLIAGTIIGSGTISNKDRSKGSSCLAEKRMLETIEHGAPKTPFMQFGDEIKIEMTDQKGKSLFGCIHQKVERYSP